jgi:group I intron endonuclease
MGFIYCIECLETGEKYIGSTKNFHRRMIQHKSDAKRRKRPPKSKQIIDRGNYTSCIVEEVEDDGKLLEREQYHINATECINKVNPFGFDKKAYDKEYGKWYREENHEKEKVRWTFYNQANREKYREKIVCECGHTCTLRNKARHRRSKKHLLGIEDLEETAL